MKFASPAPLVSLFAVCFVLGSSGCGSGAGTGDAQAAAADHVVERSTENGIETVRTSSGSRWSGRGRLLEELAIGDEIADEAYLFGRITDAWATAERIYLIDAQIPVVRAFDGNGRHLFDIGSPGQGPGEYGLAQGLVVTDDGNIAIADVMGARINIYDHNGGLVEDRPAGSGKSALGLTLAYDGRMFTQTWSTAEGRMGMRAVGPDGPSGETIFPPPIDFDPATVTVGRGMEMIVPFAPAYAWAFTPGGEVVVGTGERYRFEIHRPGGRVTAVERYWQPVSTSSAEADFYADVATGAVRQMIPEGGVSASEIPADKPAFTSFFPDRAGRVWLVRQGPGRPDPSCTAADRNPTVLMSTDVGTSFAGEGKPGVWEPEELEGRCWADAIFFDLFDLTTGDFLGTVDAPEPGFRVPLFADEDTVLAAVADDRGTVRLKKYRLQID